MVVLVFVELHLENFVYGLSCRSESAGNEIENDLWSDDGPWLLLRYVQNDSGASIGAIEDVNEIVYAIDGV